MNARDLGLLNFMIASLHNEEDVINYNIDPSNQIRFPRGFLRTLNENREFIWFITDEELKTRIAQQMMLRDTLHWLWLKTDILAHAREMLIKQQLINLGTIVEAMAVFLTQDGSRRERSSVYTRLDLLQTRNRISPRVNRNCKELWECRRQIHLHLIEGGDDVRYNNENYVAWHQSVGDMIAELSATMNP
ncbi:hypothetical protein [Ekhidna sp.]|jgi:hypothetical protein|uniref:hypothetical protein n=1 Tax=Ekhidna sp. TaxID=2608089 RepID=UPI0032EF8159